MKIVKLIKNPIKVRPLILDSDVTELTDVSPDVMAELRAYAATGAILIHEDPKPAPTPAPAKKSPVKRRKAAKKRKKPAPKTPAPDTGAP